ncbi:Tol-Pal system beta propeller repeat protein TolB [Solirhodobacter olei]|uniref:Tol-Pal system beta propeller repeat protein TolB n=1 Tax=Solirhodobacter olei TaxID=2493082 RepID=UPI0013E3766B
MFKRPLALILALALAGLALPGAPAAQAAPLKLRLTQGVIEPLPYALPAFIADGAAATQVAQQITGVIADDLTGTGLFRQIPSSAFISKVTNFDAPVRYADWKAINAQALITGAVSVQGGKVVVKFRLFDVFNGAPLGEGLQFAGPVDTWRRMAHKVADAVYSRITGESGYFDSRVVYVAESGPKTNRVRRLAIMDYDGANTSYLTDGRSIVLAPRFSPDGQRVIFVSYQSGFPHVYMMDLATLQERRLDNQPGTMTFAPRFSPDGRSAVYSLERDGNTDLYSINLSSGQTQRLTQAPSIETAPDYSPDGSRIVFESDRSGQQQIYVMSAGGGGATRISFGPGKYATPVWSPRGDLIAFTKQDQGRFYIGVMKPDGSDERLLTASFLDEGPTWAPNGRVIMFTREAPGSDSMPQIYSVDVSGRNLKPVPTQGGASDPSWGPLRK